jgi:hypothetical protein
MLSGRRRGSWPILAVVDANCRLAFLPFDVICAGTGLPPLYNGQKQCPAEGHQGGATKPHPAGRGYAQLTVQGYA